jgi:hypothetical protein
MKFGRMWLNLVLAGILAMVAVGCSGLAAGGSVSPATFLLPGLMKAEPKAPAGQTVPAPLADAPQIVGVR